MGCPLIHRKGCVPCNYSIDFIYHVYCYAEANVPSMKVRQIIYHDWFIYAIGNS